LRYRYQALPRLTADEDVQNTPAIIIRILHLTPYRIP
jgi:hypothetical protein